MTGYRCFAAFFMSFGLIAAATLPLSAQGIDGRYDGLSCQTAFRGETALDIAWPEIRFYESTCLITGNVPGATNTFAASCSGEGDTWTLQFSIAPTTNGGLVITGDGFSQSYIRC